MACTLAHVSDLHFGAEGRLEEMSARLAETLYAREVDHVVVTGDVTHRGRAEEYAAFLETFHPLIRAGRVTVIPGNHDRGGDDVADMIMLGARVRVCTPPGLYLVLVDSTGPHNRTAFRGHGLVTAEDLLAIDEALAAAPDDRLVAVLMHHHPYPLPEEGALEMLSRWVGLPYAAELDCGPAMLRLVRGRCDLLLHGHRHIPRVRRVQSPGRRDLGIYNAGSSPELGRCRVFVHRAGALIGQPQWLHPLPLQQPDYAMAWVSAPAR